MIHLRDGHATAGDSYRHEEPFGDATVPIVAACRADVAMTSNTLRRVPDKHGNLHRSKAALDEIEGILTAKNIVVRAPDTVDLQVAVPELVFAGQDIPVQVTPADGSRQAIRVTVTAETGHLVDSRLLPPRRGTTCTV